MTPTQKTTPLRTDTVKENPMYLFLAVLTIGATVGLQAWTTLFNNFAVEVAGLGGDSIGIIQSIREIPGFLALLAVFAILFIKEHRLSALSILFLGDELPNPFYRRCCNGCNFFDGRAKN